MRRSKTILIVAAVAVVAIGGLLAATVVLDGGFGPSDSDETTTPEQGDSAPEQEPVSDDSGNSSRQNQTDDGGIDGEDNRTDADDPADGENETEQPVEMASLTVTATVADLGPAETGNMVLYNRSSGQSVAIHDFEDGNTHTFENLSAGHTYEVEAATETAPPETVSVTPEAGEQVERSVELGYEMNGASTFEATWYLEYKDGTRLENGYSALDMEGNYRNGWEDPETPERFTNFLFSETRGRYTNAGEDGWYVDHRNWKINGTTASHVVRRGLSGIRNRTYLGETVGPQGNETVHEYELSAGTEPFNTSVTLKVKINPQTGYVVYNSLDYEKISGSDVADSETVFMNHDSEDIEAVPDDFPEDNPPE